MTTTYRYIFADLLSNNTIAELPLTNVSFTQQLNQAGTFSGSILLTGIDSEKYNAINGTIPGRTTLFVDRDGTIIWGGIIWGRSYNSNEQTLSFNAREFESYFERRRITTTTSFTNQDQLAIARNLITQAQSAAYGDIGILVGTETSGINLSRTYYGYEHKQTYQAIQDIARQEDGFDFLIECAYDGGGTIIKTLKLGYPRIGTAYTSSSITVPVFELPASNIVFYDFSEDASNMANTVYALGAGSNEGKLIITEQDTAKFAEGWALLEEQSNYSDVTSSAYLEELAEGQVLAISEPIGIFKIIVPAFEQPLFGSYSIGDDARLRITDQRFPTTLDEIYRIVGITVTPGEDGPERVTLTLTTTTN